MVAGDDLLVRCREAVLVASPMNQLARRERPQSKPRTKPRVLNLEEIEELVRERLRLDPGLSAASSPTRACVCPRGWRSAGRRRPGRKAPWGSAANSPAKTTIVSPPRPPRQSRGLPHGRASSRPPRAPREGSGASGLHGPDQFDLLHEVRHAIRTPECRSGDHPCREQRQAQRRRVSSRSPAMISVTRSCPG